mgnify:CR=1 FL=1
MKKSAGIFLLSFLIAVSTDAQVGKKIDTAAHKVSHKTAKVASQGKSAIVDNKYKDKVGPNGETIFIDHSSKYYYIDNKGKKVYVSKSKLKDKKPE